MTTLVPAPRFTGIAIALLVTSFVYGQRTRPAPSPNPPTVPGAPGGGTRTPGIGNTTQTPNRNPVPLTDTTRPIFLSGKVLLSDGTTPPDPVLIERVCGMRIIPEGMTDRKGRFSFRLGQDTSLFMDASTSENPRDLPGGSHSNPNGGVSEMSLMNCELRANLAGFRSESVNLAMRRSMDNPDVGIIILTRLANVEGLTISATSVNAPKDAQKAFRKGHDALGKGKLDDARKNLQKAVELYPKYAVAWFDLGVVNDREKDTEAARKNFSEAMAADPKYVSPLEGMAQMAARERKWQEAADLTDRIIRLNPYDFPRAYFVNAVAKLNLDKLDEAEKSANALIAMDTRHQLPRIEQVLGVILAQRLDYTAAAVHMRKFLELAPDSPESETARKQLAQLEKSLAATGAGQR